MAQEVLADRLDVTFQQIQKCENGKNQIRASRLYDLARALGVPIAYFFEGLTGQDQPTHDVERMTSTLSDVGNHEGYGLNKAFARITDAETRALLLSLLKRLGDEPVPALKVPPPRRGSARKAASERGALRRR